MSFGTSRCLIEVRLDTVKLIESIVYTIEKKRREGKKKKHEADQNANVMSKFIFVLKMLILPIYQLHALINIHIILCPVHHV